MLIGNRDCPIDAEVCGKLKIKFTQNDLLFQSGLSGWSFFPHQICICLVLDLSVLFDLHFSAEGIIRSHIAVGFMPMTGQAAKDPKVRFEFGPGGATLEDALKMDELRAEYKNAAEILTTMGYNGEMLDVEPVEMEEATIPADEEAQIEHLVANKLIINKAGGLFKMGMIVVNARVVLEGAKRVNAAEKEANEAAVVKRGLVSKSREDEGVLAHLAWVKSGRPDTQSYLVRRHWRLLRFCYHSLILSRS
jgi:hypothetical protein